MQGKVVFITGGNCNIGRAKALCLASKGADVVITQGKQEDTAAQTVKDLIALGVSAAAIQVDLAGTAQLPAFVVQFKQHLADWGRGDFDILVKNAGTLRIAAFDRVTEDNLDIMSNH